MRGSRPIPFATAATSTSSFSQTSDTMLMNEILVARKALAACLISSAVVTLVTMIGQEKLDW